MENRKGRRVVLVDNQHESLRRRFGSGHIPVGTIGEIIANRKLESDPEECLLIKWRGAGGPRHTQINWVKEE